MASVTTNYGFDVPTSSDLVKNGATAISTLGQDLDTFLFRPFSRNVILNSSFNVWQRGTSIAIPSGYVYNADRWQGHSSTAPGGYTVSRQATGDTTNLPNIQYCARVQRDSGSTNTGAKNFYQTVETANSIPLSGKTVTFSFYARAGANFSASGSSIGYGVLTGTGTDQNAFSAGFTGQATAISANATLTTTWQRFTSTATLASTTTEVAIFFNYAPTGTAGANDYFEVTGVQLEVGNQVSPYAPTTPTYATELAACQRYYFRNTATNNNNTIFLNTFNSSATGAYGVYTLPVVMRIKPTLETSGTASHYRFYSTAGFTNCSTVPAIDQSNEATVGLSFTVASGLTAGQGSVLMANNTTSAYLGFIAEL